MAAQKNIHGRQDQDLQILFEKAAAYLEKLIPHADKNIIEQAFFDPAKGIDHREELAELHSADRLRKILPWLPPCIFLLIMGVVYWNAPQLMPSKPKEYVAIVLSPALLTTFMFLDFALQRRRTREEISNRLRAAFGEAQTPEQVYAEAGLKAQERKGSWITLSDENKITEP